MDSWFDNRNLPGGGPEGFAHRDFIPFQAVSGSSGVMNPLWRAQIRALQNATTSFSGVRFSDDPSSYASIDWDVDYTISGTRVRRTGQTYGYLSDLSPPFQWSTPGDVVTQVNNRCIRDFVSKYNDIRSTVEAGQDFGELKETLHAIRHPLDSLRRSIDHYFAALTKGKHKYRGRRNSLKQVLADTYLEFHFGWAPLVADIAKAIVDAGRFRYPVYPISASASENWQGSIQNLPIGSLGFFPNSCTQTKRLTFRYSVRIKGVVRTGSDKNGLISRAQSLQLTPDRWLPTAWDLLPYSWMADYFTNIGDIINAVSTDFSNLAWGCKTIRDDVYADFGPLVVTQFPIPTGASVGSNRCSVNGGNANSFSQKVSRVPVGALDLVPKFAFSIPTGEYPYLNMAAILTQKAEQLVAYY
jgi:hypothetical protein